MADKRCSDSKVTGVKKKRRAITLEDKINIVKRHESGMSLTFIARSFGLPASTVNTIVKDKQRIKEHVKGSAPMMSTVITKPRSGVLFEMEKLLIMWIEEQNRRRIPVSRITIREKAKSLYEDLKAKKGETEGSFIASYGWFSRFIARANLRDMKVTIEADSSVKVGAEGFPKLLAEVITEGGYLPEQVFTVYETALLWKRMPEHADIDEHEKRMAAYLADKDRVALLFGGNSAGDFKLKPVLVSRSENQELVKIEKDSLPVVWMTNLKGCISITAFEEWFWHHLIPQLEEYCKNKGIPFNILLFLDNTAGYPPHLDNFHPQIKVVFMSQSINSVLRPLYEEVIAKFKAYYLYRLFSKAIEAREGDSSCTLEDFWKFLDFHDAIINIAAAWEDFETANMNGIWRKLCPQLVIVGKEQVDTLDELATKIVLLAQQADLYLEIHDVKILLESPNKELSNEELMELQMQRMEEESANKGYDLDVAPRIEPPKDFTMKKLGKAFRHIDAALACFKKMDPDESRFTKFSTSIWEAASYYKEIYDKKKAALNVSLEISMEKDQQANQN